MSKSQLIVDSNNVYIHKEDGSVLPVNHPDISTQPSILPQRFGKLKINEVLVQISSKNELKKSNTKIATEVHVPPDFISDAHNTSELSPEAIN